MRTNKKLLAVTAAITCCVIAVWFSTSIHGSQNTYELRPQIAIPEHKTDITRVIDAYERLMERYMDLTDRNSALISTDIESIAASLDSIDGRLAELSARTARIEKTLGIKQPATPSRMPKRTETNTADREARFE
ncbi:MAG: hypothetical protein U9Q07_08860, partial [Planctomycetota bacterium]|nr:hypothetical protein [Planctomycetota bacterium]